MPVTLNQEAEVRWAKVCLDASRSASQRKLYEDALYHLAECFMALRRAAKQLNRRGG